MKSRQHYLAGLVVGLALTLLPANAQDFEAVQLSAAQWRQAKEAESALNRLDTLESRFIQVNPDGTGSTGQLTIQWPGKMRVDYDPPQHMRIVATHGKLQVVNLRHKQVNFLDLDTSPLGFLLADRIRFDQSDIILTDFESADGVLRLSFRNSRDPEAGALTLVFLENPMMLRQWEVLDATGARTRVTLDSPTSAGDIPARYFDFHPGFLNEEKD